MSGLPSGDPDDAPPGAAARREGKAWNDEPVPAPDAVPAGGAAVAGTPTGTVWEPTPTVPFPRPPAEPEPSAPDLSGPPPRPLHATWGRRATGWVLDQAVMLGPALLALEAAASTSGAVAAVLRAVAVVWAAGWFVGNRVVAHGRTGVTLGKSFVGVRLLRMSDGRRPCGWRTALWREVLHLLDALWLVGFLRPLWDGRRRTFADSVVDTSVLVDL